MNTNSKHPIKLSTDAIRSYYYLELDQKQQSNSGIVIDDACYELMFVKEKNVKIITGKDEVFLLPPSYTLNNLTGPFRFEFSDTFSSFCIKLQPWMNASYVPSKKSQLLNLNKLYPNIDKLQEALFVSESVDEMVDHAEQFLLSIAIFPNKDAELIKNVCSLIYAKSGDITVTEIADKLSIYRQKLNLIFKQEVKYTLKTFINNVRIRFCLAHKLRNPEISLTDIAYQFGFHDQAHFNHSFKKASGVSPSEYINKPGYSFLSWEQSQM